MAGLVELQFRGTRRFELISRLGAGGMGVVHEAFDRERQARVALKTLRYWSGEALLRFKHEFRAVQGLQHPNLVRLDELIEDAGQWLFTMELIQGPDILGYTRLETGGGTPLGDWRSLGTRPPPDAEEAAFRRGEGPPSLGGSSLNPVRLREALRQLARGLAALHALGKVHRDIKSSNIRVTAEGRVVLVDFGLVSNAGEKLEQGRVGTAGYMAPEQAAARPVGPEADWYGLGVVLYEALTGQLPFVGPPGEVMEQKQRLAPVPPEALVPGLPSDLALLCRALLEPEPGKRPSGRDVLHRLRVLEEPGPQETHGLLGTQGELDRARQRLEESFRDSHAGPVAVVLQGPPGVGKRTVMRRFSQGLQATGAPGLVLAGRCSEREQVPFRALDGAMDALSRRFRERPHLRRGLPAAVASLLARVFPVLAPFEPPLWTASQGPPLPLHRALHVLLQCLGQHGPTVLMIDDLQWADPGSLQVLSELLRPPEPVPFLLVASLRTSPSPDEGEQRALAFSRTLNGQIRQVELEPAA